MAKPVKIILALIFIPIVVIVAVLVGILLFVDPNDYRDRIEAAVLENTGRTLAIEGDIGLTVFPRLGLELGRVSLGNAPGFGDAPFARVEDAEVRAQLLPLLRRELRVGTLSLNGLRLNLQQNADGANNWSDLAGAGQPAETGAPAGKEPAPADTAEPRGPGLAALAIGGLKVADAQVSYQDGASGARYEVRDLALTSGAIELGAPTDLQLSFQVEANEPALDAGVDLETTLTVDPSLQQVTLAGTELRLDAKGAGLPVPELALQLTSDLALDLAADTLTVAPLTVNTLGMELGAEVQGTALTTQPQFAGRLHLDPVNPRDLLERLGQAAPEMSDSAALGKLSLDTAFSATPSQAALTDLKVLLDDTSLTGKLSVTDFARQSLRFELAVDAINLDRYLPPPQETPPPSAGTATVGTAELPMELLRALDVQGTIDIGRFTVTNLSSEAVKVGVTAKGGRIRVHPATARLYGGSYEGDIGLDARGEQPVFTMDERLNQVQIGPLLKDMTGEDTLLGTADLQAKLTARGANPDAIQRSLSGSASFAVTDGMVNGINVAQLLREARAKLKGEKPPAGDAPNATDFAALTGSATLKDGVVTNRDFDARSPLLRVQGRGTANLPEQTMDYRVTVAVVGTLEGQGGKALRELKGLAIPLRVHGTFAEPRFRVELGEALAAREKARVEAAKQELKAKEEQFKEEQERKLEEKKDELKRKLQEKLKLN